MTEPVFRSKVRPRVATIPDEIGDYVPVRIENVPIFDIYDLAMQKRRNVLNTGDTGCGKTTSTLAYAAERGMPFYSVANNVALEPSQLFGKYIPDEGKAGSYVWQDGPVTDLVRFGGVLNLGEINFMADRIATVLFPLLDRRRQITLMDHKAEVIDAADDLLIIGDMNHGYQGTRPLNKALRNRFAIQLEWDYSTAVESQLVKSTSLREMAGKLRAQYTEGELSTPVSTNMLQEFEELVMDYGFALARSIFLNHFDHDERQAVSGVMALHSNIAIQLRTNSASSASGYKIGKRRP